METHHHHHDNSLPFFYAQSNNTTTNNNHNQYDDDSDNSSSNNNPNYTTAMSTNTDARSETASSLSAAGEREHMFEKPLTPSDVGKLNRLVIPKQHAEKYFPLAGDSSAADKSATGSGGVLLGFEDEARKCWRFRYSYWNSSQSYVLTKGWSRYVKEKKLDAGDVVFFERHRVEPDRFFIGWRRRRAAPALTPVRLAAVEGWTGSGQSQSSFYNAVQQQQQMQMQRQGTEIIRQRNPVQKAPKSGNSRRLRLFGVNLECQLEEDDQVNPDPEPQTSDGSSLSSQGAGQGSGSNDMGPTGYNSFDYVGYPPANHHNQCMVRY
ncbi:hypothetical protein Cgig2_031927 [Carnegiea gigantea]|uniref:TF-B3 domain-containing protein n=1 Tax=Carnegiea gigantea TaxID=171969 RepID=A0A9Q1GRV0_9CARY|nr:hypothetical protein Cgig2_031927 [Carnegiea gigantea]